MEQFERLRASCSSLDNKVKSVITALHFGCVGNVSTVYSEGKRIDVTLPYKDSNGDNVVLKGVEVLRPGTHKVKVVYTPEKGDLALVFAMQDLYIEGKFNNTPLPMEQCPAYDRYGDITLKAILVQTNEYNSDALNIEVKDSEVNVTCNSNQTVNIKAKQVNINNGHLTVD